MRVIKARVIFLLPCLFSLLIMHKNYFFFALDFGSQLYLQRTFFYDKMKSKNEKGSYLMAKRRMFLCEILQSDDFYKLPLKAQLLYVHFNLSADDDGLLGNPNSIARYLSLSKNLIDVLVDAGYLIRLESGVVAITHWHLHNKIRKDRYTESRFSDELSMLEVSGSLYKLKVKSEENQGVSDFFDNQNATKESIGNFSVEESNSDESREGEESQDEENKGKINSGQSTKGKSLYLNDKLPPYTPSEYRKSLSEEEGEKYDKWLNELRLYYFRTYGDNRVNEFIREYEQRGWKGTGGEDLKADYKKTLGGWRVVSG